MQCVIKLSGQEKLSIHKLKMNVPQDNVSETCVLITLGVLEGSGVTSLSAHHCWNVKLHFTVSSDSYQTTNYITWPFTWSISPCTICGPLIEPVPNEKNSTHLTLPRNQPRHFTRYSNCLCFTDIVIPVLTCFALLLRQSQYCLICLHHLTPCLFGISDCSFVLLVCLPWLVSINLTVSCN